MADNKRDVAAARRLLRKYGDVPPSEVLEWITESKRKRGHPPHQQNALNLFIYDLVEIAKKWAGLSNAKAFEQVAAYFKACCSTPAARKRWGGLARTSYSIHQIKRWYSKGRALGPDIRSEYPKINGSRFKVFLDKVVQ
jgi:hypothetical protein